MAAKPTKGVLGDRPTLDELTRHVNVSTAWSQLGVQLKLDPSKDLDAIDHEKPRVADKLSAMFHLWLERNPTATRRDVLEALRNIGWTKTAEEYKVSLGITDEHCDNNEVADIDSDSIGSDANNGGYYSDDELRQLCSCGQCTLQTIITEGCPDTTGRTLHRFPLLDIKKLPTERKLQYLNKIDTGTDSVNNAFDALCDSICVSMKGIHVDRLKAQIRRMRWFDCAVNKQSLHDRLDNCHDVEGIFLVLADICSWFNHRPLKPLVERFGSVDIQKKYDDFIEQTLLPFLQRSITEIPKDSLGGTIEGSGKFYLKMDTIAAHENIKGDHIYKLKVPVAEALEISIEDLYIISVLKGCIEITFLTPLTVYNELFPLSAEHSQALLAIVVPVDEHHLLSVQSIHPDESSQREKISKTTGAVEPFLHSTSPSQISQSTQEEVHEEGLKYENENISDSIVNRHKEAHNETEECDKTTLTGGVIQKSSTVHEDGEQTQDSAEEHDKSLQNVTHKDQDISESIVTRHTQKSGTGEQALNKVVIREECDERVMETFKQVLSETIGRSISSGELRLLVVGRTGEGKSTLINSIIDSKKEIAKEGADTVNCTDTVKLYSYSDVIPGVKVTLIDSPGLQDTQEKEQSYIKLMKSECQEVSLVLYCMKMTNYRLTNDDKLAMQKLHLAFGPKFWKRVVFVLTFANDEKCGRRDNRDKENEKEPPLSDKAAWKELKKTRFAGRMQHRALGVKEFLKKNVFCGINAELIQFIPAGDYKATDDNPAPLRLPDREDWLNELLKTCCHQVKVVHAFKKLSLNDKIHLAVIIDNDVVTTDENDQAINNQAREIKDAFEKRGFCVLYFNGLNSESIACLLESLQHVDPSELASFALVILSKGKTHHVYDVNNELVPFEDFFVSVKALEKVPKLVFFHLLLLEMPESRLVFNVKLPSNSIAVAVSVCPSNDSAITAFIDGLSSTSSNFKPLEKWLEDVKAVVQSQHRCESSQVVSTLHDNYVLPTCYEPSNDRLKMIAIKKKLQLHRAMWHHVRCKTLDVLQGAKDEVLTIVRAERIAKIAAFSASVVVGGGLVVIGLILIPFTFGGSIALSVAGGAVGAAAGVGSIGALITAKVMASRKLKKAQQHIRLDQQLSKSVNEVAAELYSTLHTYQLEESGAGGVTASGIQAVTASVGGIGVAAAVGAQGVVETSAIAVRTAGRAAGMALAGATLAVTVPIDIGMIAYNSFLLHKSSEDKSGKTDKDAVVKWFVKQIEEMLKGASTVVYLKEYKIGDELVTNDTEYGFKVLVPGQLYEKSTLAVRTILSGPFDLPEGATLVSAIYDVQMEEKLQAPVTIEIEHCVDITDQSTAEKMTFATATVDLDKKVFVFTPLEGGTFPQGRKHGSISLSDSSLLCILYYGRSQQDQLMVKYAAQCFVTREFRNFSKMNITFTKCLSAHYKYIRMESLATSVKSHPFKFTKPIASGLPCIELEIFRTNKSYNGWRVHVSPDCIPDVLQIRKQEIDTAELQDFSKPHSSEIFPSLTLDIQVEDEEKASDELKTSIEVPGTDLRLDIKN